MADIFDYLRWRADIPFTVDSFNEVDNLILSELAYTDFEDVVDDAPVALPDVYEKYFSLHTVEEVTARKNYTGKAPLLLEEMAKGARFRDTKVSHYYHETDKEKDLQVAAVTYHLGDGTIYVAFRGTDSTVVGWKEDFNLSFMNQTEGQLRAVQYLDRVGTDTRGVMRVGGHSKGGNFAVYAAAFCDRKVQDRIREIYTNDGPGFREEVLQTEGYKRVLPRMISIVPETSVIGMLLETEDERHVIDSSAAGLIQHDGFTWQVQRNRFVTAKASHAGIVIDQSVRKWLAGMSDEDREIMTDTAFTIIEATGIESFLEVGGQKRKNLEAMYKALRALPKEQQARFLRLLGELVQAGGQTVWSYFLKQGEERENNADESDAADPGVV